eukprot:4850265-Pyramimonas_sp.AAC.1
MPGLPGTRRYGDMPDSGRQKEEAQAIAFQGVPCAGIFFLAVGSYRRGRSYLRLQRGARYPMRVPCYTWTQSLLRRAALAKCISPS